MKKVTVLAAILFCVAGFSFAGTYLNLGADYAFIPDNYLFDSGASKVSYFNGSAGYAWDFGLITGLRYDHFGVEDQKAGTLNARFVGAIPAAELGYYFKFLEGKLLSWTTVRLGYAISARYRLNVDDHKATAVVPSITTAVLYQIHGQFYAGLEIGYRYFDVEYADLDGARLNLSGMIMGLSLIHLFN